MITIYKIGLCREEHHYGGSRRQPLDLHTLWRLLEHMDKEARKNGLINSGHNRKNIGLSNIDGEHIPSIDDIGTHSARKGAATHCSTGSTVSPPMASIWMALAHGAFV